MLTHQEKGALAMPLVIKNDHSLKQIQCEPLWSLKTNITIHHNQLYIFHGVLSHLLHMTIF
jgi:hypothetical protein